ncbi:bactofilin family protein [Variovorax sp. VNK109]|uniref:bactofilin family protein n=1 Tax=Variovorax sp. VNK109 TaxID=3400919 RepID=UPI003C092C32
MAMQSPFFGKRESDTLNSRNLSSGATPLNSGRAPQTHNAQGEVNPAMQAAQAVQAAVAPRAETKGEGGSKLTVGPNIKLKGVEITDCDTLVVEGTVEATMDSRVIEISERGAFKGSAEIDIAEIHGEFDGNLTVRQKLVIHSSGRVTGKIRYGKLIIEEGGQLAGEIECAPAARLNPATRQGIQAAA